MTKLLLTSAGITNQILATALKELVGKPPSTTSIAFIPTAANTEAGSKGWLIDDLRRLKELGYAVDIVDISAIEKSMWLPRLESADIIFVGGGNTYHLLHWVRLSGLEEVLPKLLETRVYAGISAGSIITGPSLQASSLRSYYPEDVGKDSAGLKYVDFHIRPHLNSPSFPKVRKPQAQQDFADFAEAVYVIDDQTAIQVVNGDIEVIGEGDYLVVQPRLDHP